MNLQPVKKDDTAETFGARYNLTPKSLIELNSVERNGDDEAVVERKAAIERSLAQDSELHDLKTLKAPSTAPVKETDTIVTFAAGVRNDLQRETDPEAIAELKRLNPDDVKEIERSLAALETIKTIERERSNDKGLGLNAHLRGTPLQVPPTVFGKPQYPALGIPKGSTIATELVKFGVTLDAFLAANQQVQDELNLNFAKLEHTELSNLMAQDWLNEAGNELKRSPGVEAKPLVEYWMPSPRKFKDTDKVAGFCQRNGNITRDDLSRLNPRIDLDDVKSLHNQNLAVPPEVTRYFARSPRPVPIPTTQKITLVSELAKFGVTEEAFQAANRVIFDGQQGLVFDEVKTKDLRDLKGQLTSYTMPSPRLYQQEDTVVGFCTRNKLTSAELHGLNPQMVFRLKTSEIDVDDIDMTETKVSTMSARDFCDERTTTIDRLVELNPDATDRIRAWEAAGKVYESKLEAAKENAILRGGDLRSHGRLKIKSGSQEIDVANGTTIEQFARKVGVPIEALLECNPDDPEHPELVRAHSAYQQKLLSPDGSLQLNVGGVSIVPITKADVKNTWVTEDFLVDLQTGLAELRDLNPRIAGDLGLHRALPEGIGCLVTNKVQTSIKPELDYDHENRGFEWLTYETVLNNPPFRRTNQSIEIPLYSVEMESVDIWLREGLADSQLDMLCEAFFPDVSPTNARFISNASWPWKNRHFFRAEREIEIRRRPGSRGSQLLVLKSRVVLPYNPFDNHENSLALGTRRTDESMKRIQGHTWPLWKTASRSCVVNLKQVKTPNEEWDPLLEAPPKYNALVPVPFDWPWKDGDELRKVAADLEKFKTEVEKPGRLELGKLGDHHVSLKTGVCYVGSRDQSWKALVLDGKDAIDGNWIVSCLRSDYVADTNEFMKTEGYDVDPDRQPVLVLTELLTIAEKVDRHNPFGNKSFRDGIQVRDLSPLIDGRKQHSDRVYVFPGSIPFLGRDAKSLTTWYESRSIPEWRAFWREAWAVALGNAKALFLLRYGLQHKNPNPQNYLIELQVQQGALVLPEGGTRLVIRDLQDAALHREVVWALYGTSGECPKSPIPEPFVTRRVGDSVAEYSKRVTERLKRIDERAGQSLKDAREPLVKAFKRYAEWAKSVNRPIEQRLAQMLWYEFETIPETYIQETGSVEEDFGGPGVRFGWWRFSTGTAMNRSGSGYTNLKAQLGEQGQAEVFELLGQWGFAHNAAFVQRIEAELGLEIRTIDWTKFPAHKIFPDGYTPTQTENGYKNQDTALDDAEEQKVQGVLASKAGRVKIAAYRKNVWQAQKPVTTWKVVGHDRRPIPWRTVLFETKGETWSRPTDGKGQILLFDQDEAQARPRATQASLYTYDKSITPLALHGDTWSPVNQAARLTIQLQTFDGKPFTAMAVKATLSTRVDGSPQFTQQSTTGRIDFDAILPGYYALNVELTGEHAKRYDLFDPLNQDPGIRLEAGAAKIRLDDGAALSAVVCVEPVYSHVRFIANCLLTVPKQSYDAHAHKWMAQYMGHENEVTDIYARIGFLRTTLDIAAETIAPTTHDHELKIFMVPECFFLGYYGAYLAENVDFLVQQLQRLVGDAKWRHWLFVFGTVNGTYQREDQDRYEKNPGPTNDVSQLFNVSPVIRGGLPVGDEHEYTRLLQKAFFSQEIPSKDALIFPEKMAKSDRTPLTEDDVRRGFGASENEATWERCLDELIGPAPKSIHGKSIVEVFQAEGLDEDDWNHLKAVVKREVKANGATKTVQMLRLHDRIPGSLDTLAKRRSCCFVHAPGKRSFNQFNKVEEKAWAEVTLRLLLGSIPIGRQEWSGQPRDQHKEQLERLLQSTLCSDGIPGVIEGLAFQSLALKAWIKSVIAELTGNGARAQYKLLVDTKATGDNEVWTLGWAPTFRRLFELYIADDDVRVGLAAKRLSTSPNQASPDEGAAEAHRIAGLGFAEWSGLQYSFEDSSFRCGRIADKPRPLLTSADTSRSPGSTLLFGLEVCADHSLGRVKTSKRAQPVDIHLLPSAGMALNPTWIATKDKGYAFNCDGWTAAAGAMKNDLEKRGGRIKVVEFEPPAGRPEDAGHNPLYPHSELLQRRGTLFESIKPDVIDLDAVSEKLKNNAKTIFAFGAGELHIYPSQELHK